MGNNWKITDTLTKVFADEVPGAFAFQRCTGKPYPV